MLSAVDKLHKLYSVTAEPVVWARSVGVEILNELDTVKAAMMMSAGSYSTRASGGGFSASLVENFAKGINTARVVSQAAVGVASAGFQQALKQMTK